MTHMKRLGKLEKSGSLLFGGSLFPNDGSYIFFNCEDESVPNNFVKSVIVCFQRDINLSIGSILYKWSGRGLQGRRDPKGD